MVLMMSWSMHSLLSTLCSCACAGLVMPLSKQTAMAAAAASWESVDPSVKSRYQDKAIADTKRCAIKPLGWQVGQGYRTVRAALSSCLQVSHLNCESTHLSLYA